MSEQIIGKLIEEEHQIFFSSRTIDYYSYIIPICLFMNKKQAAFEFVERSKSKALLDLLSTTHINSSFQITLKLQSLLVKEENNLTKLRQIQIRRFNQSKRQVQPGEAELIFENLNEIYDQIEEFDPEYVSLRKVKSVSLDELYDALTL